MRPAAHLERNYGQELGRFCEGCRGLVSQAVGRSTYVDQCFIVRNLTTGLEQGIDNAQMGRRADLDGV